MLIRVALGYFHHAGYDMANVEHFLRTGEPPESEGTNDGDDDDGDGDNGDDGGYDAYEVEEYDEEGEGWGEQLAEGEVAEGGEDRR